MKFKHGNILFLLLCTLAVLSSCGKKNPAEYHKISAEAAYEILNSESVILLDVREQDEFDERHIEGAILLPVGQIEEGISQITSDTKAKILVYCRSGNRSKTAAEALAAMGYEEVYDFGGIIDWPYETVSNTSEDASGEIEGDVTDQDLSEAQVPASDQEVDQDNCEHSWTDYSCTEEVCSKCGKFRRVESGN